VTGELEQVSSSLVSAGQPAFQPAFTALAGALGDLGWTSPAPEQTVKDLIQSGNALLSLDPTTGCSAFGNLISDLVGDGQALQNEANQYQEAMAAFETSEANFLSELQQLS
jgi:hypothetical protein